MSKMLRDVSVALYSNYFISDAYVACTVTSHCTVNDAYVASKSDVAL